MSSYDPSDPYKNAGGTQYLEKILPGNVQQLTDNGRGTCTIWEGLKHLEERLRKIPLMDEPDWTLDPPQEEGWYWYTWKDRPSKKGICHLDVGHTADTYTLYWPVRIFPEPPNYIEK